jgi:hypothetical protein
MPSKPDKRAKFAISEEAHRRLRIEAAKRNIRVSEMLDNLILELLPETEKPRVIVSPDHRLHKRRRK